MRMWAETPGKPRGICRLVLSERLMKSRSAFLGKTLDEVSLESGLGKGHISRLYNNADMALETINRIASVLQCRPYDLLEIADKEQTSVNEKTA